MKRLLTLTLACLALALPATAMACNVYMYTHLGANVSSRTVTGSCVTRKVSLTNSLVMRCDNSTGYAVARYDFKMPSNWCGTPSPSVNAVGDPALTWVKLDDTHVRVVVRVSGPSKVVVSSVSVSFCT
jgi:hypothetical protein